ncbi:MAG: hypothetical protein WEE20_06995 [Bacteroidota bacterium]
MVVGRAIAMPLNFIPIVRKKWLFIVAGSFWGIIGVFLLVRGMGWLLGAQGLAPFILGTAGIGLGILGYLSGFRRIAEQIVLRIHGLPERSPLTSFLAPRGYAMIVLMISLGFLLRQSPIPKPYLSPFYIAMGCVLLLGSSRFRLQFLRYPPEDLNESKTS